ncbi:hypothetical protein CCYS_02500 [Corynebacterium cystitidis DSM 20524]|uniref:Uncharacterized protein n=1 Tax=Corynebacterium cystitidis DSM 20524 TaxID=1121357 RepID=A0A1H9RDH6_9CORY|nr:hypothetical protein CCYS_02500 [Corynebacterium cystitidis DSM 20524]SER70724.1 hypothetical protein SAMN05661109_00857 [Corynebacterium cystitidis DSM 20524]SNV87174.1 Uncharacterised protein [Corynebacterium cystitidis]
MQYWDYSRVRRRAIVLWWFSTPITMIMFPAAGWLGWYIEPSPSRLVALILLPVSLAVASLPSSLHLFINRPVPRLGFLFPTARWEGDVLTWEERPSLIFISKISGFITVASLLYLISVFPRYTVFSIVTTIVIGVLLLFWSHAPKRVIATPGYVRHTHVWRGRTDIHASGPNGIRWIYSHEASLPAIGGPMLVPYGDLQRTINNEPAPLRPFGINIFPFTNADRTEVIAWLRGETTTAPTLR